MKKYREKTVDQISKKFWARVDCSGECWLWKKGKRTGPNGGYGILKVNCERVDAHRLAFQLAYGPIPDGLYVCHHCDNPPCVRPDHLFLGTHQDNMDDMRRKGRNSGYAQSGTKNANAKLNEEAVRAIRWLCAHGVIHPRIAKVYRVYTTTITDVIKGRTWGWVK